MFTAFATARGETEKTSPVFQKFEAYNGFFCCEVPAEGWELQFDEELDSTGEYEMKLMNGPMLIDVIYYTPQQFSFTDHQDFIQRNTRNVLGETRNARETYGPAEPVEDHGMKAFRIERRRQVYLHPESKSDESMDLKEKLYVVPSEAGFFVLEFSGPAALYDEHLATFEKIFSTFKPGKLGMKCDH